MRQLLGLSLLFVLLVAPQAARIIARDPIALAEVFLPAAPSAADTASANPSKQRKRSSRPALPRSFISHPLIFFSSAPEDSLVLIPGIGPVLAARIAGARSGKRSYTNWNDLLAIKGIGPKTVERLRALTLSTE